MVKSSFSVSRSFAMLRMTSGRGHIFTLTRHSERSEESISINRGQTHNGIYNSPINYCLKKQRLSGTTAFFVYSIVIRNVEFGVKFREISLCLYALNVLIGLRLPSSRRSFRSSSFGVSMPIFLYRL